MASQIEFCFDFASPYSYLAATQLPALTAATGAEIVYRPFRLLELMKIVGNRPTTIECKNKGEYARADIGRWAARYKVPFRRNPNLRSFDYAALGRGALVAIDQGRGADYVDAVYRAIWAGEQNLADTTVLAGFSTKPASMAPCCSRGRRGGVRRAARPADLRSSRARRVRLADVLHPRPDVLRQRPA